MCEMCTITRLFLYGCSSLKAITWGWEDSLVGRQLSWEERLFSEHEDLSSNPEDALIKLGTTNKPINSQYCGEKREDVCLSLLMASLVPISVRDTIFKEQVRMIDQGI